MPLEKSEQYTKYVNISKRSWKENEAKTLTFIENDKDVNTQNGLMFLFAVKEGKEMKNLWVKPQSALAIGISQYVPLKGKTLKIIKTGTGVKNTRYDATEVKA